MVTRENVLGFRLRSHGLVERSGSVVDATARCGVQNSPPGSALLALHARVTDPAAVAAAEAADKSVLQTWCMRGSPYLVPTSDAAVFTTGVLPPTEEGLRHLLLGVGPSLDELGLGLLETTALIRDEISLLSGRRLAIDELGKELSAAVRKTLPKGKRTVWDREGPHAAGQPIGEAVVHFCLRVLTLQGVVCFAPRDDNKAPFVLVEEWLGKPLAAVESEDARKELLRRYLHCYGPSTRADFASWLGVRAGDVDPWWQPLADELSKVDRRWVLTDDLDVLTSAALPKGVRLLPPRDPYTQLRDRETVVDKPRHKEVWKPLGDPGTVLVDGEIVGTWRPSMKGSKLAMAVTPFATLKPRDRTAVAEEAEQIGVLRGATEVVVSGV